MWRARSSFSGLTWPSWRQYTAPRTAGPMPGTRSRSSCRSRSRHSYCGMPGCASMRRMSSTRDSTSRSDSSTDRPPGCSRRTSIPVDASNSAASLGHACAEPRVHTPYAGMPWPFDCTHTRPKLPRDARYAMSPSSSTTRRATRPANPYAIAAPTSPPPMTATSKLRSTSVTAGTMGHRPSVQERLMQCIEPSLAAHVKTQHDNEPESVQYPAACSTTWVRGSSAVPGLDTGLLPSR